MTKKLSTQERANRRAARKQQKAASKTMKAVTQPKPEEKATDQEAQPVNLCDDCAYEFGECEGKPKFAKDQDETLTGPAADRVVKCEGFLNVAKMPTAQEAVAPGPAAAEGPGLVIVCSGGCGKTTEGIALGTLSGEFKEVGEGPVPKWTCQECLVKRDGPDANYTTPFDEALKRLDEFGKSILNSRADLIRAEADLRFGPEADLSPIEMADMLVRIVKEIIEREGGPTDGLAKEPAPETQVIRKDLPERPDPKRFQVEEDFGNCPSCSRPLKRTALNRYQDGIRCTNGRCRAYRVIVKTVSTGVK